MEGLPETREEDPDTCGTQFTHVFTGDSKAAMQISEEFDQEFSYEYCHAHGHK